MSNPNDKQPPKPDINTEGGKLESLSSIVDCYHNSGIEAATELMEKLGLGDTMRGIADLMTTDMGRKYLAHYGIDVAKLRLHQFEEAENGIKDPEA